MYGDFINKGPFELGTRPEQGKRSDLVSIVEAVKAGKTDLEILEHMPTSARFGKEIDRTRFICTEALSDRQLQGVRVIVLWGPTGIGKTYSAINYIAGGNNYYIVEAPAKKHDKVWFSGYTGQKTLILDDFDAMFCSLPFLKRLLDKYKLKVEIKGGFAWACWTTVIITSNQPPNMWYQETISNHYKPEDIAALKRRIYEIRFMEERDKYQVQDWDLKYLTETAQSLIPEHRYENDYINPQDAQNTQDVVIDCGNDEELY